MDVILVTTPLSIDLEGFAGHGFLAFLATSPSVRDTVV